MSDKLGAKDAAFIEDLMSKVPRGNPKKYLTVQQAPRAQWQDPEIILKASSLQYDPKKPDGKILLGAMGDKLIGIKDNRHYMTVAGSRAGKSVTVIANQFFYDGSMIALDPKGEQAMKTAQARVKMGQDVYVVDPYNIITGPAAKFRASFNFLNSININNKYAIEDTSDLVDAIVVSTGEERDPHWNESAGEFLTGLILHVCFSDGFKDEERHLGTVRTLAMKALKEDESEDGKPFYVLDVEMEAAAIKLEQDGYDDIALAIAESATSFFDKEGEELSSVLSSLRRHLKFLSFPSIRNSIGKHDFNLSDLKTNPKGVSVYIVLPASRIGTCKQFFRLFINKFLADMERTPTKNKQKVLMVLDEFAGLGRVKQFEDAAAQIASQGVILWFILQDFSQGKALYKDRFESLTANCGVIQAFGNVDNTTTKDISDSLGKTSILVTNRQELDAESRMKDLSGQTLEYKQFPLITPDEVSRLFARDGKLKRQLIRWAGRHPMIIERVEYFDKNSPLREYLD